uniref:Zgc:171482 n=1 Tax=Hucho hucho TaxID=62062 RepID=A0A4W5KND7_9TELE
MFRADMSTRFVLEYSDLAYPNCAYALYPNKVIHWFKCVCLFCVCLQMKSAGVVEGGLFTESYCNICNAQLISESQRTAHYESKKHANKVRLFYMLHPEDGGPPSKRLRPDNPVC